MDISELFTTAGFRLFLRTLASAVAVHSGERAASRRGITLNCFASKLPVLRAYIARFSRSAAPFLTVTVSGFMTDAGKRSKGWWSWWGSGNGKSALEHLYDAGLVAIAGRREFERTYDLSEQIIPKFGARCAGPAARGSYEAVDLSRGEGLRHRDLN